MKISKFILALPVIGFSMTAGAEITFDGQNVVYTGAKSSAITIAADGSVMVNGNLVHKCDGTESSKTTRAKLATVTCDVDYIRARDKNGNELARYSSYARATDGTTEERKLFDPALAQIGSVSTGTEASSQTESVITEQFTEKTVSQTPAAALIPAPHAPEINQKLYTPKLGSSAQQTPGITKRNTISETKADAVVKQAEKEARVYDEKIKAAGNEVIVTTTQTPQPVVKETTVITTTQQPPAGSSLQPSETTVISTETIQPTQ